jgi:23S rRNA (cytosine1962-C5)-methyltransferase
MFPQDQYQLLDFGDGRRLERFGEITLDRPCPAAAEMRQANPGAWQNADARFDGRDEQQGQWTYRRELPERWTIAHGRLRFELKRTEFGHLGLFAEQADNWDWIISRVSPLPTNLRLVPGEGPGVRAARPRVLNLFAYTGGSTLAAAAGATEVTHVDAAKNVVAWARRNAELSGLADAPIRWIAEDAAKFVKRELKRGNRYDAVILDPPSYGHGPRGEVWRLSKHLPRLLAACGELTAGRLQFMLLTCHTLPYEPEMLRAMMLEAIGGEGDVVARQLTIHSSTGRELPSGAVVRWSRSSV